MSDDDKDVGKQMLERVDDLKRNVRSINKTSQINPKLLSMMMADDLVPVLSTLARYVVQLEDYVGGLDERIADLEEPESQLTPEDAQVLIAHIEATNELIRGLIGAGASGDSGNALKELLSNGEKAVAAIHDITMEPEDEDDDEDEDEDEEEGEESDGDDEDDEDGE